MLDFGLSKALAQDGAVASSATESPTLSNRATAMGVILGTPAYMSPEQASGKGVDKNADIWAFGVVLHEMLTGRPLFGGDTVSETLAAVIKDQPKLDDLPSRNPTVLKQLLARCLERDPRLRLRDIGEARIMLSRRPAEPVAAVDRRRAGFLAIGATLLAVVAAAVAWQFKPTAQLPHRRFELPAAIASSKHTAISPDGTRVAYVAGGHLYVRPLDALDARDLGAIHVTASDLFWSPDARTIGFSAEASIYTVPADGGPFFTVCRIPASGRMMGVRWLTSGQIVFSVWRDSLYSVPATGGTPVVRLAIDPATEVDFHDVSALTDDRLIVATHERKEDSDRSELLDGTRRVPISTDPTAGPFEYVPGFLVFLRRSTNAGLWVVPFKNAPADVSRATLIQAGATDFSVARDGTLLFALPVLAKSMLVRMDRSGATSPVAGPPVEVSRHTLALSPTAAVPPSSLERTRSRTSSSAISRPGPTSL